MLFLWYPKCSTCQKAKKWLDGHGISYELRDIKEEHPSAAELEAWQRLGGLEMKKLFNTSGMLYRSMNLKEKLTQMSDKEKIELLATDGMLVKRPLLIAEDAVLTGFREAEWEKLL